MKYFLGVDIGATKTAALICDEQGQACGYGMGGSGNPENVGYEGMEKEIRQAVTQAVQEARIQMNELSGAGFGVGGFDWDSLEDDMRKAIEKAGLTCPVNLVNDAVLGLVAGTSEGWGVAVVSGTGCNCRGRDKDHKREGRVTGFGILMGENAGGTELIHRTMQTIGYSWTKRLPPTALSDAFIKHYHAKDLEDLIEGYTTGKYNIAAEAAPIVFQVASRGDAVAQSLVHWAGTELGEMANAVIHQLDFHDIEFEIALIGSMFKTGEALIAPMRSKVHEIAPNAKLIPAEVKPVVGAVLLGMEAGNLTITTDIRQSLNSTPESNSK